MKKLGKTTIYLTAAALSLAGGWAISADKKPGKAATAEKAAGKEMVPVNLAAGKTATSSSYQNDGLKAEFAVDGDEGSRWCAENGNVPQWLAIDLGKAEEVAGCKVVWEKTPDQYKYKIETSADGKAWTAMTAHAFEAAPSDAHAAKGVRYIRVTVEGTKPGAWASIKELEVQGTQLVAASSQKKAGKTGAPASASAIKAPAGWDVSIFAGPPEGVNYCTTVCATIDGSVYVGIDEQGSLGREKGRGRVVRLRDTKGTGKADEIVTCVKIDNPRGVWVDGNDLYVLGPPLLMKYKLGPDGVATGPGETLVSGITVEESKNQRGADHTTNGFRVGVDGWLYVAMGDFGCMKATGKDGTVLQKHNGGVVRVRLDGSGLEDYSFGQRNIYDVAIDPYMHVFTRDNTNDGGGWNDRLSYVVPSGNYGYPRLFQRWPGEFIDCLVDYGGGSPCGSLWVDEPALPASVNGLLTVEWGASKVFHHPLKEKGADYERPVKQEPFLETNRPTDIDYDGNGHFYLASWAGGGFSYSGPNVGFCGQISLKDFKTQKMPVLSLANDAQLVSQLLSPSMKMREAAQREIVRRGAKFDPGMLGLSEIVNDHFRDSATLPLASKAAAIFTLKQIKGDKANAELAAFCKRDDVREVALRALADKKGDPTAPLQPFIDGMKDKNPKVRMIAAWGAGRLSKPDAIPGLIALLGDEDFLVQHVASNALVALKAGDASLATVDPSNAKVSIAALRVLQQLHDVKVVEGLADKAKHLTDPPVKSATYAALCRLYYREADWTGQWWGTRPDTSGPYFKTQDWEGTSKVNAILEAALKTEPPEIVRQLVADMQKHKIDSPVVKDYIAKAAKTDPKFRDMLVEDLSRNNGALTADQVQFLKTVATDEKAEPAARTSALRVLAKNPKDATAINAMVDAFLPIITAEKPPAELAALLDETVHDAKFAKDIAFFVKLAETGDSAGKRELGYAVLINIANGKLTKGDAKATAAKAIDRGWEKPATAAPLLHAVGRLKAAEYKAQVSPLTVSGNPEVASAAAYAANRLGIGKAGTPATPAADTIETVGYDKTVAFVLKEKGDAALGKELFTRLGCIACHTTTADEPPKGPFLGGISQRYSRTDLCESIMKPNAKIAQGFETQWFKRKSDDEIVEGFVTREAGDEIELRNATGVPQIIKTSDIAKRGKRDTSIMPEGLVVKNTPQELAGVIAYLETLKGK
jgi:putative heme-binding domain-containing protein